MVKANDHPVTVILRDWSKTKKGNSRPVAEIHSKRKEINHEKKSRN